MANMKQAQRDGVLIAAIKRALKVLEQAAKAEPPRAGTYAAELTIQLAGDVVVGQAVPPGDPKTVPSCTVADALIAYWQGLPDGQRSKAIADGVAICRRAAKNTPAGAKAAAEMDEAQSLAQAQLDAIARRARFTEERQSRGRAGAVTGKPGLVISGTINGRKVELGKVG
jgi:hypothetical protein